MIPAGYHVVPTRALMYQHCRGYDPELLRTDAAPGALQREQVSGYMVRCPVCEHAVSGSTAHQTVSDWNDHCIARLSAGRGT